MCWMQLSMLLVKLSKKRRGLPIPGLEPSLSETARQEQAVTHKRELQSKSKPARQLVSNQPPRWKVPYSIFHSIFRKKEKPTPPRTQYGAVFFCLNLQINLYKINSLLEMNGKDTTRSGLCRINGMTGFSFFVFSVPFLKPDLQGKALFKINSDQIIFH